MSEELFNGLTRENFIARWTEALRSGKYAKTVGFLHTVNGWCCLGVLCDVAGLAGHKEVNEGAYSYFGEIAQLPAQLAKHLDINENGGLHVPLTFDKDRDGRADNEAHHSLANINDDTNYSFSQIADVIEQKHAAGHLRPYSYLAG